MDCSFVIRHCVIRLFGLHGCISSIGHTCNCGRPVPIDDAGLASDGGLLAAVVLLSVGYLFTHQGSSPEVDLMHGVPVAAGSTAGHGGGLRQGEPEGVRDPRHVDFRAARPGGRLHGGVGRRQGPAAEFRRRPTPRPSTATRVRVRPPARTTHRIATQDTLAQTICTMPGIERAYVLYDVDSKPGPSTAKS